MVFVLLVVFAGICSASGSGPKYDSLGVVKWVPGDRVFYPRHDLLLQLGVNVQPDKVIVWSDSDWWGAVVYPRDAASDTSSEGVQVKYPKEGVGISGIPVFLVSDAHADTLFVECFRWNGGR
jgi:hypothetical protein